MKTIPIEETTLNTCVDEAQGNRVIVTRNGTPIALVVGVGGLDEEQVRLSVSDEFWKLITERREQRSLSRVELERRLSENNHETP
jgi:antitoxin (DNA-binding transcriptional repressor) of toxin-antitoxin stability system